MPWDGDTYIETADCVHRWCPACQPEGSDIPDPWELRYCDEHRDGTDGESDRLVTQTYINQGESGGDDARMLCDFIHRGVTSTC